MHPLPFFFIQLFPFDSLSFCTFDLTHSPSSLFFHFFFFILAPFLFLSSLFVECGASFAIRPILASRNEGRVGLAFFRGNSLATFAKTNLFFCPTIFSAFRPSSLISNRENVVPSNLQIFKVSNLPCFSNFFSNCRKTILSTSKIARNIRKTVEIEE